MLVLVNYTYKISSYNRFDEMFNEQTYDIISDITVKSSLDNTVIKKRTTHIKF